MYSGLLLRHTGSNVRNPMNAVRGISFTPMVHGKVVKTTILELFTESKNEMKKKLSVDVVDKYQFTIFWCQFV